MKKLISKILKEETSLKQRLQDVIDKLGFVKAVKSVGGFDNFIKIMGYDPNQINDVFKQFLLKGTFTQNDINSLNIHNDWPEGTITFKFDSVNFETIDNEPGIELDAVVLDGTAYDYDSEEFVRFSSGENPFDDFSSHYEFKDYVESVIADFVGELYRKMNPNQNSEHLWVNVTW